MKVLIAVEDSRNSDRAVRFVARMRWPAGSRVIVAGVHPLPASAPRAEPARAAARAHAATLTRAQDRLRQAGLSAQCRLEDGVPRERLLQLVAEERADLLVLGSRGHRGLLKWLLRSVSSHAVTHAPCSVLVVKQTAW